MAMCAQVFLFVAFIGLSMQASLPSKFIICKRSSSDFNDCLKASIQDALPKLKNGIPEFNFPKLDPIRIPKVTIGDGATGAVRVTQHYKDVYIYNFTGTTIDDVKTSLTDADFKMIIDGTVHDFVWNAKYELQGQIFLLPISGTGNSIVRSEEAKLRGTFEGKVHQKKGKQYIKVNSVRIDMHPKSVYLNMDNLFDGNEQLGNQMNQLLNDNWKEVWEDIKPSYEQLFEILLLKHISNLFDKVSVDDLFPQ